jgi:hypothetical protein
VAGLAAVTGCSASSPAAAGPTVTVTATAASATAGHGSATATSTPAPATPAPSAPAASASATPAAVPVLGQLAGVFGRGAGFGQVRPPRIFNGGDPTGLVTDIAWKSWGGARAVGTGTSDYVRPSQPVAAGAEEPVTVVAFSLGTCDGKLMYRAVEWYFPQHGQAFRPGHYENICAGSYVPSS